MRRSSSLSLVFSQVLIFSKFCPPNVSYVITEFVGNKAKGQISKHVLQEHKAHQIFRKTNISYPLTRTCACTYQGVRNIRFWKIRCALFPCNTHFDTRLFVLLPAHCPELINYVYTVKILPCFRNWCKDQTRWCEICWRHWSFYIWRIFWIQSKWSYW